MKNELRKVILDKLSSLEIVNDFTISWNNSDSKILKFSLKEDVVKHEDIEKILHAELLKAGRQCFLQHINIGTYPDHINSPKALAYALDHNEFTTEEEKQIKFDGETKEGFIQQYGEDVIEKITKFLQTEQKIPVSSTSDKSDYDSSCCGCDCCH